MCVCYTSSELHNIPSDPPNNLPQAVEQEILQYKRFSCELPTVASSTGDADSRALPPARDLALSDVIGAGGFGVVWKGAWKNMTAAIKVGGCFWGRVLGAASCLRPGF